MIIEFILSALYFLIVTITIRSYISFASMRNITAKTNFRTLHKNETPKGGGIIIFLSIFIALILLSNFYPINRELKLGIFAGGSIISIYGFIDDIIDIQRYKKFSALSLFSLIPLLIYGEPQIEMINLPRFLIFLSSWFLILWFLNAYNFIDGIDGLASSVGIFVFLSIFLINFLFGQSSTIGMVSLLIILSCSAFLVFNFPPARVFMGDSGSLFLGYSVIILLFETIQLNLIDIWTWLILLSFILGETTTTSILRIFLTKKWYGAHRSHAYQNLARVLDSHRYVLLAILSYHILWLLPLALLSIQYHYYKVLFFSFAIIPVIFLNLIYGPKFSSK